MIFFLLMLCLVLVDFALAFHFFYKKDYHLENIKLINARLHQLDELVEENNMASIPFKGLHEIGAGIELIILGGDFSTGKGTVAIKPAEGELYKNGEKLLNDWAAFLKELESNQQRPETKTVAVGEFAKVKEQLLRASDGLLALAFADQEEQQHAAVLWLSLLFFVTIFALLAAWYFYQHKITKPVEKLKAGLGNLVDGQLTTRVENAAGKEMSELASHINAIGDLLFQATEFTKEIAHGNLEVEYAGLEKGGVNENVLTSSLLEMREKMKINALADMERNWLNEGLTMFSEILRVDCNNLEELNYTIISKLVKYLKANQGSIFLMEGDDAEKRLRLSACYAYERRKYQQKEILPGEGLLGQVVLEKDTIYLTDVPGNYVQITSGLGQATPTCILIVPIKVNDVVYGVIELASFKTYDDYERQFVEKVCESIAATISSVKANTRTRLLLEESQEMTEEMRAQEEEMRQSMEELQATQEEMSRKQIEVEAKQLMMEKIVDLVPFPVFVKDSRSCYLLVNKAQERLVGLFREDILGRSDSDLMSDQSEIHQVRESDEKVLLGRERVELPEQVVTFANGSKRFMKTIKVPFENNLSNELNLLGVSIDNTDQRLSQRKVNEIEQELGEYIRRIEITSQELVIKEEELAALKKLDGASERITEEFSRKELALKQKIKVLEKELIALKMDNEA